MRKRWLVLGLAAAGAGAGMLALLLCGGANGGLLITPGTTNLKPWEYGPPTERNVPAIPPGGRFCRAADVQLRLSDGMGVNSLTTAYYLVARNIGVRACVVRGLPAARVIRQGNGPLTITEAISSTLSAYPPAAPAFGLSPGKEATSQLLVVDECIYPTTRRSRAIVRLGLAGDMSTQLHLTMCTSGVTLVLEAWQPPPLPEREHEEAWPLEARLSLSSTAPTGRQVSYRVSLRNRSRRPFRFGWCPSFWAGIDGSDGAGSGVLNCGPVGDLQPGESVAFPLQLRDSRHFRPGCHVVRWGLIDSVGETPIIAQASVQLTRG